MRGVKYAGRTDTGRVRRANQDRWLAEPGTGLCIVADGMGGAHGGELASTVIIEALPGMLHAVSAESLSLDSPNAIETTLEALKQLSNTLRAESKDEPGLDGMGSTAVLAIIRDQRALIAHLGDSRAYRLNNGMLEQLTVDHTVVQLLTDIGEITPAEARCHPARGQLTRFVGMEGEPLPEATIAPVEAGDQFLLCSDGLTEMLDDPTITQILITHSDASAACDALIDAANAAGGTDNITCVVVKVECS